MPMVLAKYTGYYGTSKRIQCPIHLGKRKDDFLYRNESFICWSCGAKGDIIAFVSALKNISMGEAAKLIQNDFNVEKPQDEAAARREYQRKRNQQLRDQRIEQRAANIIAAYHRYLHENLPERGATELTERNYIALREIEQARYYCDIFINEPFEVRLAWVKQNHMFLRELAENGIATVPTRNN